MAFISAANTVINNNTAIFHTSFEKVAGTTQSTVVKIRASDPQQDDFFGFSVAAGSGRIVVGAYGDDDLAGIAGSAYIFDLNGTQLAKIKASDGLGDDLFGYSVAVGSGRIVVGAYGDDVSPNNNQGSVYVFDLNGNQLTKINAPSGMADGYFGWSVAVGCGRIVVGAERETGGATLSGTASIFSLSGTLIAKIQASDSAFADSFGYSVAIGCGRIVIGSPKDSDNGSQSGSAYIFDLNGTQIAKIKPSVGASSDFFGNKVAVGSGRIVVGAYGDDTRGSSAGAAYIFDLNGTQLAKIVASDGAAGDDFGFSVAAGCGRIVVGAFDDESGGGSAYVFDLNGTELSKIRASDTGLQDFFGGSVAVGSGRIVAGAHYNDQGAINAGAAYIYKLPETHDIYYENVLDTFRY